MQLINRDDGFRLCNNDYQDLFSFWPGWGFCAWLEFPSEWCESTWGTLHFQLIWGSFYFHFPWFKTYPDHGQCEGPRFGFAFHNGCFWLYYGNTEGKSGDPVKAIHMPWDWGGAPSKRLAPDEQHDYTYVLESGERQEVTATIYPYRQIWRRWWLPHKRVHEGIHIEWSESIGEEVGTYKGGTLATGFLSKPGETPLETMRRMERDYKC